MDSKKTPGLVKVQHQTPSFSSHRARSIIVFIASHAMAENNGQFEDYNSTHISRHPTHIDYNPIHEQPESPSPTMGSARDLLHQFVQHTAFTAFLALQLSLLPLAWLLERFTLSSNQSKWGIRIEQKILRRRNGPRPRWSNWEPVRIGISTFSQTKAL